LADTVEGAERVAAAAKKGRQKAGRWVYPATPSVVGALYSTAQQLGKPLVMRMNLNQTKSWPYVVRAQKPDEVLESDR
jgi:hypothetical protein